MMDLTLGFWCQIKLLIIIERTKYKLTIYLKLNQTINIFIYEFYVIKLISSLIE